MVDLKYSNTDKRLMEEEMAVVDATLLLDSPDQQHAYNNLSIRITAS
jgi:hypothetical protein